jgi:hypothetical protein
MSSNKNNYLKVNGIVFKLPREINEPEDQYSFRKYWISYSKPKNKEQFEKAMTESFVARNIKFLNCKYSPDLMEKIQIVISKII